VLDDWTWIAIPLSVVVSAREWCALYNSLWFRLLQGEETECETDGGRLVIPYIHAKGEKKTSLDRQDIGMRYGSVELIPSQTPQSVWSQWSLGERMQTCGDMVAV